MLNFVQSQKQTLKISPSQIQLLNFFQLNSLELENYIKNELEENPVLEEGSALNDDFLEEDNFVNDNNDHTQDYMDWDEFGEDNLPDYKTRVNNYSEDGNVFSPSIAEVIGWREEIKEQLHVLVSTDRQKILADFLVDSLTDEGYLQVDVDSLVDDVSFSTGIFIEEYEIQYLIDILHKLQPIGLGASNLQECLTMQLERGIQNATVAVAKILVNKHFEELSTRNYDKIKRLGNFSTDEIRDAVALIATLKPQPVVGRVGNELLVKESVIPDYLVMGEGETLDVTLNKKGIPPLHINKSYSEELGSSKAINSYLNAKINAANWLIDAILQRESTMLKTMKTIVKMQKAFFTSGDIRQLKPMVLQDIAESIKMDISTVSRVTSGKYAQTPFGVIHLKDLFTEGMKMDGGEEVSNRQIQIALAELVTNEDKRSPLNDFQLTELLSQQGYQIARRTVAKYREVLDILPAPLRRIL
jgi:RNA polymerase sigma-54 factor